MWPRVCELEREKSKCVTECGHKKMHALQLCTELFYESKFSVLTLEGILKNPKESQSPDSKARGAQKISPSSAVQLDQQLRLGLGTGFEFLGS